MKKILMYRYTKFFATICLMVFIFRINIQAQDIFEAVEAGDLVKVQKLIDADSMLLEAKDNVGGTPLHLACGGLQVKVANFLIDKGADVNAKNKYRYSVLSTLVFAANDNEECLRLIQRLIDKGAEVNQERSEIGLASDLGSPLHWAAITDNLKVAKFLIDNGSDLQSLCRDGTPLQFNILWPVPHEEMAKLLVENGAKPQEYSKGNTDVHLAAIKGYADLLSTMVKYGADINAVNEYGHTPLYYAARYGYRMAAEVLIAAGADQGAIEETNYGKASQLTESLRKGEAYLWDIGGTGSPSIGYAVKTKNHLLIFNPSEIGESPEEGLANGHINPNELAGQKITALISYQKYYGRFGKSITELAKRLPNADFVLNFEPTADSTGIIEIPSYKLATPNESFSVNGVKVHTIPAASRTFFSGESLGYLVETDGVKVFHAGLHVSDNDSSNLSKFHKEIDFLKPFGLIDIAILLIDRHHVDDYFDYKPYLYLIDQLAPKAILMSKGKYEDYRSCIEVLKARDVPVFCPEVGIAVGERFHYVRE